MMTLEYFRHDPIGNLLFAIGPTDQPVEASKSVSTNYPDYSMRAFYLTMQDIQELEYSKGNIVPDGRNSIVASTFWFLALESYITTLLKFTCLYLNKDFKIYGQKKPAEKLSALLDLLEIDSVEVKKTGLYSRINEFTTFRNEIFHDRNAGNPVKFAKTLFCPVPIQCNLVDTLQGMLILLETIQLLRLVITGLDTMPDILINEQNKVFHKKLDYLFLEVIQPSMKAILVKHKLFTNLDLNIKFPQARKSTAFTQGKTGVFRVADSPGVFVYQLNPETTNISYSLFSKIVENEEIEPNQFQMGNYTLKQ